jgi:hypothetical protein
MPGSNIEETSASLNAESKENDKIRVRQALSAGAYWICCEECEVISWSRMTTSCLKHAVDKTAYRVRGSIYTGD